MSVRKQKKQGWDMELCEYQNKRLLRENKIPVLKGNVAYTVEEAVEIAKGMSCKSWRLHVQLPLAEKIVEYIPNIQGSLDAHSIEEVETLATTLFNSKVLTGRGMYYPVQRIYVEELCQIEEKVSLSMRVDTQTQKMLVCIKSKKKTSECELPVGKPSVLFWCRILKMFHFKNVQEALMLPILKQMYAFFVKYNVLAIYNSIGHDIVANILNEEIADLNSVYNSSEEFMQDLIY